VWGEQAERVAARLCNKGDFSRGDRHAGDPHYGTGAEGSERRKLEVAIDELGASLLFRDVQIERYPLAQAGFLRGLRPRGLFPRGPEAN